MFFGILMLAVLWGGYLFLAPRLEQRAKIDIHAQPPVLSAQNNESFRFLSYRQAQMAQIGVLASVQVLFGALTGIFYGPLQMLWIVGGTLLFGTTVNYFAGLYAMQHNGQTWLCAMREMHPKIFAVTNILALVMVLIGVAGVCLATYYVGYASHSYSPVLYLYFAGMFFLAFCNQSKFNIFAMFNGFLFVLVSGYFALFSMPELPNIMLAFDGKIYPQIKFTYPMMFFAISTGVLSGVEMLKCCLVAPAIKNEKMVKGVYFGSSILVAGLMIVWAMVMLAWNPDMMLLANSLYKFQYPYELINTALLRHFNLFGFGVFYLMLICLCISGGATLLRTARQMAEDSGYFKKIPSEYVVIVLFVLALLFYAFSPIVAYFEVLNMLLVCVGLFLLAQKRELRWIYFPAIAFFLGACVAQVLLVHANTSYTMAILNGILTSILLMCGFYVYRQFYKKTS